MATRGSPPGWTRTRLALGMATFGSATPVSRIVAGAMPVAIGAALRVGIGAAVLAPYAWLARREIRRVSAGDWARIGVIAVFGMFGFTVLMLEGMQRISGVAGAVVMSTTPAVTAAASVLFLGDTPTWRKLTAIALAVAGVVVLHLGGEGSDAETAGVGNQFLVGSVLVFGAVCCEAVYTLVGKRVSASVDPVLAAFLATVMALPLFLPMAARAWAAFEPANVPTRAWLALAWYGAGTLAAGTWLWYSALRRAEGVVAAAFMGVMPASALLLSYVLLGEPFRLMHLAGFLIVGGGVALMSIEHARMARG